MCIQSQSVQRGSRQDAAWLETKAAPAAPDRGGGRTGPGPRRRKLQGAAESGGDSRWVSADVKYLGQLGTKRLNLVAGAFRSGPAAADGDGRRCAPLLIGTRLRLGVRLLLKMTRTVPQALMHYSSADVINHNRTGQEETAESREQTTAREHCQTLWCGAYLGT